MAHSDIQDLLFANQDLAYAEFHAKLIPNIARERVIGVRVPVLREIAKNIHKWGDIQSFLSALPHSYFEENQLHALLLSIRQDFEPLMAKIDAFLPFADNWATCDLLSPKIHPRDYPAFLEHIQTWIGSDHEYTIRFGVGMMMQFFLGDAFEKRYLDWVVAIRSEAYYVNMMIAWFFATALVKQYDASLPYLAQNRLSLWTHNKAIQKAIESRRISPETKSYLRSLKR